MGYLILIHSPYLLLCFFIATILSPNNRPLASMVPYPFLVTWGSSGLPWHKDPFRFLHSLPSSLQFLAPCLS